MPSPTATQSAHGPAIADGHIRAQKNTNEFILLLLAQLRVNGNLNSKVEAKLDKGGDVRSEITIKKNGQEELAYKSDTVKPDGKPQIDNLKDEDKAILEKALAGEHQPGIDITIKIDGEEVFTYKNGVTIKNDLSKDAAVSIGISKSDTLNKTIQSPSEKIPQDAPTIFQKAATPPPLTGPEIISLKSLDRDAVRQYDPKIAGQLDFIESLDKGDRPNQIEYARAENWLKDTFQESGHTYSEFSQNVDQIASSTEKEQPIYKHDHDTIRAIAYDFIDSTKAQGLTSEKDPSIYDGGKKLWVYADRDKDIVRLYDKTTKTRLFESEHGKVTFNNLEPQHLDQLKAARQHAQKYPAPESSIQQKLDDIERDVASQSPEPSADKLEKAIAEITPPNLGKKAEDSINQLGEKIEHARENNLLYKIGEKLENTLGAPEPEDPPHHGNAPTLELKNPTISSETAIADPAKLYQSSKHIAEVVGDDGFYDNPDGRYTIRAASAEDGGTLSIYDKERQSTVFLHDGKNVITNTLPQAEGDRFEQNAELLKATQDLYQDAAKDTAKEIKNAAEHDPPGLD